MSFEHYVERLERGEDLTDAPAEYLCRKSSMVHPVGLDLLWFRRFGTNLHPREKGVGFLWYDDRHLNIGAVMEDSDPFSEASGKFDDTWLKGDVVELFLQPATEKCYFEIHVAPNMATLELSIPESEGLKAGLYAAEELFFESGFCPETGRFGSGDGLGGWWAHIKLPMEDMGLNPRNLADSRFCICRYNYNRHWGDKPELSSTSSFGGNTDSFHRPEHWHRLAIVA